VKNNNQNQRVEISHPKRKIQKINNLIKNNQAVLLKRSMKEKEQKRFYNQIRQVWS
jgi:hypothetical protein